MSWRAASGKARVGFQNSATGPDLGLYAARLFTDKAAEDGQRLIRFRERSATGFAGLNAVPGTGAAGHRDAARAGQGERS